MSQLLGNAQPNFLLRANDNTNRWLGRTAQYVFLRRSSERRSFVTPWWPKSALTGDPDMPWCRCQWGRIFPTSGMNSRFSYAGVTRDKFNSPIPGMTVKLFRAVDDSKQDTQVSDPGGVFLLSTPFYEAHWMRSEKTGSPNVQGTSDATVFPNG